MLNAVDMQAELWGKELDILSMDASSLSSSSSSSSSLLSAEKKKKSIAILGRRLEIFLDYLGALCVDFGSFLLSESNRFSGNLERNIFIFISFFVHITLFITYYYFQACFRKKTKKFEN